LGVWKVHNIINLNHIPFNQCIFSFLNKTWSISQSFRYMGPIHHKIKVHTHVFFRHDKNCCQSSKVHFMDLCLLQVLIECPWSWCVFCIIGKVIVSTLHKWVPLLIFQRKIYLNFFKYVGNIIRTTNVIEILGHHSV
jgi:hypothetical protein